jgi:SAM-dependent methyltransferase
MTVFGRPGEAVAMPDEPTQPRFYGDLAAWWPLISPPDEYTEEAAFVAGLLASASIPVHEVLELGAGGGSNASHLKAEFTMTLTDLSDRMLDVSRRLNPECGHIQADMRTMRLGRSFDAVLVHDAIAYMTTVADLRRAMETAFVHCRPGGVAVFVPDEISETFEPSTDHGGTDAHDGRGARYLEWTWSPGLADTAVRTEYVFLLRGADGSVQVAHETHRTGLFGREVWLGLLADVGFTADAVREETSEDRRPRELFIGHRTGT